MAPATLIDLRRYLDRPDVPTEDKLHRLGTEVVTRDEHEAAERVASVERASIARRVDGLEVLARTNAEAQRATGDAVVAISDRLEAVEGGVLEVLAIVRAEQSARQQAAADARASDAMLEARIAPVAADAAALRAMVAPIVADAARKAGNAGAVRTAGAFSVATLIGGLVAQPVETVRLVREIGPMGLVIAVVLLAVAAVVARLRRS